MDAEPQEAQAQAAEGTQEVEEREATQETRTQTQPIVVTQQATESKPRPRPPQPVVIREPGRTILPLARVQRIMKADKLLPACAKEATVLIAIATEEFIKRLTSSANAQAAREKRSTVSQKDLAVVVKKQDEFLFLEEIIPMPSPVAPRPRVVRQPPPVDSKDNRVLTAFISKYGVPPIQSLRGYAAEETR